MSEEKIKEQNKKIEEVVKLFEKIQKLVPDSRISLEVHQIDVKNLNDIIWEVDAGYVKETKSTFLTGKRKRCDNKSFDITLFD